jgi:hypothetical protein
MSHTLALLLVPNAVFTTIAAKFRAANYHHAILEERDGTLLDMTGIALEPLRPEDLHAEVDNELNLDDIEGLYEQIASTPDTQSVEVHPKKLTGLLQLAEMSLASVNSK